MSTYAAKGEDQLVHAVYDQTEVYVLHRGREDVAVCGTAHAWYTVDPEELITCLYCIAVMDQKWCNIHSDPPESAALKACNCTNGCKAWGCPNL